MKLRNLILLALSISALAVSGCNLANEDTAQRKTTFMGIYTYEPGCFAPVSDYAIHARTEDMCGMELPSGDRTQFLWGLVSIEDY